MSSRFPRRQSTGAATPSFAEWPAPRKRRRHCKAGRALLAGLLLCLAAETAPAQEEPEPDPQTQARKAASQQELEALREQIVLTDETLAQLAGEITTLEKDQATLRNALVKAAAAQRRTGEDIERHERRLLELSDEQDDVRASLRSRRGLLGQILAALQRMGRSPPPALLVTPEDALGSVRSAILLGAVVPEIRKDTEALLQDLQELARLREKIGGERKDLVATMRRQAEEERKVALLLAEKRKLEEKNREDLAAERKRSQELAEKARSLQDLIAALQAEISLAEQRAEAARLAEEEHRRRVEERRAAGRRLLEEQPEPVRLTPAQPFSSLRGKVPLPVNGSVSVSFGDRDRFGQTASGLTMLTQTRGLVTAPADGWVLYAGPFRSYGQLLILNAGDGYHIVMAGMQDISVAPGQFVVAGEPVAVMGETKLASAAALALDSSEPTLYMELRKDGKPIDPQPFLADDPSGRNKNDS